MPSDFTWSMRGLRPFGNFFGLTVQSPRPARSWSRAPNQPSSITKRSTPRRAAFSASAFWPGSSTAKNVASQEL